MQFTSVLMAASLTLAGPPSSTPSSPPATVEIPLSVVTAIDELPLPAREEGALVDLDTDEGAQVSEGDVLGKIDARDAQLRLKVAQNELIVALKQAGVEPEADTLEIIEQSGMDAVLDKASKRTPEVRQAEAVAAVAEAEYDQVNDINRVSPSAYSHQEVRRKRLTRDRSVIDIEVAEMNQEVAALESKVRAAQLESVANEIERRTLRAPFDGVVAELIRHRGEWVRKGDPVLRLTRMDRLRVQGFVDANQVSPQEIMNKPVTIYVDLARDQTHEVNSRIGFVSPEVHESGRYRVWAEVDNPQVQGDWLLRPGQEAEMVIHVAGNAALADADR